MAISVFISIDDNQKKINAIKEWRTIVGTGCAQHGLSEAKTFIENQTNRGYFQVLFTDAQFGRFVVAMNGACNGAYADSENYGSDRRPSFSFHSPEYQTSVTHDFTK